MMTQRLKITLGFLTLLSGTAFADQFHYNNVLLGERAAGLGGAFCAVADDASAVVYNPAGLGFALANDISGSANAFYQKSATYKKTIGKKSFTEKSKGTLSPIVGALGKLDHISPGLVFAFGIYSTDSELKDQDDLIKTTALRFHRTANVRASTNKIGIALGKRFGSSFSFGFGVNYVAAEELVQEYQDAMTIFVPRDASGKAITDDDGNPEQYLQVLTQNIRQSLTASGVEPVLGFQYAFGGSFSVGLSIMKAFMVAQRYDLGRETTVSYLDPDTGKVIDASDTGTANPIDYRSVVESEIEKKPLEWPAEIRAGFAWFATTSTLITSDIVHRTAADGALEMYDREAVTNYALGVEQYITPSWPLRFGLFTNMDARPEVSSSKMNQQDHIDYYGASLFIAMAQPNSQISVGLVHQYGVGKAQKVGNTTEVQDVVAQSDTVGFTVSHSF